MKDLDMNDHTKQYRSIGGHRISISHSAQGYPAHLLRHFTHLSRSPE